MKKILNFPRRPRPPAIPVEPAAKTAKVVPPPKRTLRTVIRKIGADFEIWHV